MSFQIKDPIRDDAWLLARFTTLYQRFFPDVAIENTVIVRFGRKSIRRFGSIISKPQPGFFGTPASIITINRLFMHHEVPVAVIDATLLHEFVHYTHGFHSPRRQQYAHPHRGNIVNKEIYARGGGDILIAQQQWIKDHYRQFLTQYYHQF
jgi:hypothetical protein